MRRLLVALLIGFPALSATALRAEIALAAEGDAPTEQVGWRVSATAPATAVAGEPAIVPVEIKVLPGHYIYRESTKFAAGKGATGIAIGSVAYPKTTTKFDKYKNKDVEIYEEGSHIFSVPVTFETVGRTSLALDVKSQACTHEFCLFPTTQPATIELTVAAMAAKTPKPTPTSRAELSPKPSATAAVVAAQSPVPSPTAATARATPAVIASPAAAAGSVFTDENRMAELIRTRFLFALMMAFAGGLAISLTPCVYPMIPITISIIGAQSAESRSKGFLLSLVYVGGICLVYSALALVAALSSKEFGFLLQSPWMRLGITAVFVALAASMFGAFHLELPSSVATKLSTYKGSGYAGVFVTGLFSGLVAGPCTAPVLLGILLAISSGVVGVAGGFALMLSFSLGMGVLFVVLGTFSGVLASLPRSGAWMVRVKHVFGFLLLGAALYYAQLVIPAWAFAAATGAVLVFAGIHLGAGTRLDAESGELPKFGKAAGMVAVAAGLYFVVAGLAISGVTPQIPGLSLASAPGASATPTSGIAWIPSEADARAQSLATGKPMLIDFYADWCVDCKALDAEVYTDARVIEASKRFVAVKINTTVDFNTPAATTAQIDALKAHYDVRGLPRVVFVRPDGTIIPDLAVTGIMKPETFLQRMTKAGDAVACDVTRMAC